MSNTNTLIPTGIYRGRGVSFQLVKSSKKDTDGIEIVCAITVDGPYKDRRATCNCWITDDKQAERALQSLRYCGWDGVDLEKPAGFGTEEVDLVVEVEDPQPKPRDPANMSADPGFYPQKNRIAFINQVGSGAVGRGMSEQEKSVFSARMQGLMAKMQAAAPVGQNGKPAAAKPVSAPTSAGGSKLPF